MTVENEEVADQVEKIEGKQDVTEEAEIIDNDPMIVAMKEAEAELAGEGKEAEPEGEKPKAEAEPEPAKDVAKAAPVMIPKARLDEVIGERDRLKEALNYTQGIAAVQGEMLKGGAGKPADVTGEQKGQAAAATEPLDHVGLIAKAEADKLEAAREYEDGEIGLVDFEKQRIDLDRVIRAEEEKRTAALFEGAKQAANEAVYANAIQAKIETEAARIQEQHPYIAEIDNFPPTIRDGVWAGITKEAAASLASRGINPADGTAATKMALIQEKAALTNKYGPQLTGKKFDSQATTQPSTTAKDRAAKLDLSQQQPPDATGTGVASKADLTSFDIENMSQDQIADMLATAPQIVQKAAGFRNR